MELTIVMYHYVRPLERSRYPNIKGRRLSEFRRQLDYLVDRYRLLRVEDVVAAVRGEHALPPDAALLTFDDGFADHYDYVFPLLDERGLQGAFFPPAHSVLDRELLDVHKIQFILASSPDVAALRREVDVRITADRGESLQSPDYYWQRYAPASRFDPAEAIYIKRLLQVVLPPQARQRITSQLFARFVTVDEAAFSEELFVSLDQLRLMQRSGMCIGNYGYAHRWLGSLSDEEQRKEVDRGLDLLRQVGAPEDDWVMCYPYGDWDDRVVHVLRQRSCALGLTTKPRVADLTKDDPLLLPRLDTNDLPH
jgi:peptidoglycan/xylan/chitin deacetylase (PgdA/CDA1 family)